MLVLVGFVEGDGGADELAEAGEGFGAGLGRDDRGAAGGFAFEGVEDASDGRRVEDAGEAREREPVDRGDLDERKRGLEVVVEDGVEVEVGEVGLGQVGFRRREIGPFRGAVEGRGVGVRSGEVFGVVETRCECDHGGRYVGERVASAQIWGMCASVRTQN